MGLTCGARARDELGSEQLCRFHYMPEGKGLKGGAWLVLVSHK